MDWPTWQRQTEQHRGYMLQYYREALMMESWEAQEQERKMLIQRLRRGK